jgi:putative transposase
MPKYKKKREAARSLNYTRNGFRLIGGRLRLVGGIVLTVVWSRDLPAEPSSVRVYRDGLGRWYASFVVAAAIESLPATGRVIGVDWGVKETATTTSDAHDLPHAEHGRKSADRLARYQRMTARRSRPKNKAQSKGYRAAQRQAAKVHKRVARQRQDIARKWAKRVVRDHDALAVEDFRPKFLAKTTMARKAADAAIGATKTALLEMGRKHGRTDSARVMLVRAGLAPAGADGGRPDGTLSRQAACARNPPDPERGNPSPQGKGSSQTPKLTP